MAVSIFSKPISLMGIYTSACVFLFSALLIAVPNGYSYGPCLLLLGSLVLIVTRPKLNLERHDWLFIAALFLYFFANVLSNLIHSLPVQSYDLSSRYLLSIPVYFLLIAYQPNKNSFWLGLIVGAIAAGFLAIYQRYILSGIWWRVGGFINPIQFGDICVLMAGLLVCGLLSCFTITNKFDKYKYFFFFAIAIGFALLASFFSWSRGSWLAIPLIVLVFYCVAFQSQKRKILLFFLILGVASCILFLFLPDTNSVKGRILQGVSEVKMNLAGDETPNSVNIRMNMWVNGIQAFKDRPLIGWGNLESIKLNYAPQWEVINSQGDFNHLHNSFIDELAKRGMFGFLALIFLLVVPFCYFLKVLKKNYTSAIPFAAAGIMLILCVIVFGFTQVFNAHNSGVMVFTFYLVIIKAYCRNIISSASAQS